MIFDEIDLDGLDGDWLLGTARLRATGTQPDSPVFIGVAPSSDVETYLRGAGYSTVDEFDDGDVTYIEHAGGPPAVAPADSDIWTAQASGTGTADGHLEARGRQLDGRDDERRRVLRRRRARPTRAPPCPSVHRAVHWLVAASVVSGALGVLVLVLVVIGSRRRTGESAEPDAARQPDSYGRVATFWQPRVSERAARHTRLAAVPGTADAWTFSWRRSAPAMPSSAPTHVSWAGIPAPCSTVVRARPFSTSP